jgi:hypothetical protein
MRGTKKRVNIEKRKRAFSGRNRADIAKAQGSGFVLLRAEKPPESPRTESHYISKVLADAMGIKLPPGAIGATLYGARWTAVLAPEVQTSAAMETWYCWARWACFKPFNSYWQCRCCLGTWWEGERVSHASTCALQQAKPR